MASPENSLDPSGSGRTRVGGIWAWLRRAAFAIVLLIVVLAAVLWFSRKEIAANVIDDALAQSGLEASYEIAEIGAQRQVIENLVVGDPSAPDLTARRILVDIEYSLGAPAIGKVQIEQARLFGSFKGGTLSFGALDPVLFADSETVTGLPAIDLKLVASGARLATDYGVVGASLTGAGRLDDGFDGTLALTAPGIGTESCNAAELTAYGNLTIANGAPRFQGPVRLQGVECEGATMSRGAMLADLAVDETFSGLDGLLEVEAFQLGYQENSVGQVTGDVRFTWANELLTLMHELTGERVDTPFASLDRLQANGRLRSDTDFKRSDWSADLEGSGGAPAQGFEQALAPIKQAADGTLIAPLIGKFQRALGRAARGSAINADLTYRTRDGETALVAPRAFVQTAGGERVLALSRLSWKRAAGGAATGELTGNFITGGADLPQITGRMEQVAGGELALRLAMAPYRHEENVLALPRMQLRQMSNGSLRFTGAIKASGQLPGGMVSGLELPLNGNLSQSGVLALGASCETVKFSRVELYDLTLDARAIELCPKAGKPLVLYNGSLDVAADTGDLALSGTISDTQTNVTASRATIQYPGPFLVENIAAQIGPPDNAVRLTAAALAGSLDTQIGGTFEGATAQIDVVPLDLSELAGQWRYKDDILGLSDTQFRLRERTDAQPRFEPLNARGASLTLVDNVIRADALLHHPGTGKPITDVSVLHDLGDGVGQAVIDVDEVTFGSDLSVENLSGLALGVVAFADGSVSGEGQIDWTVDDLTSRGTFYTDGLNLAAAFGPVRGLKGRVTFSDLLNLTTEPDQVFDIGSINPGIEVLAGRIVFSMREGTQIDVKDGRWPFMGGELIMRPVRLRYGTDDEQRYTFEMIALDAAKFVTQMELNNLGATGTFDGTVPIVFDAMGNGRIEHGLLISRVPGGNVSYIGDLLYEDMGAISNYAFQSLRSLDYRQMSVELDGDLAGEIVTKFQFDGVRQGEGASQNFVTRELAQLPIRFRVNVRSENFYELATMVRTFWDTSALPDPIDQGLLEARDGRFVRPPSIGAPQKTPPDEPRTAPDQSALRPDDELPVQAPESEDHL